MTEGIVEITAAIATHINVAFHQNAIPVIQQVKIENDLDRDLDNVELHLRCEPAFATPLLIRIERIAAGATYHLPTVDLKLDQAFLRKLVEGVRGSISITAEAAGEVLARHDAEVQLLPPSHWGGTGAAPELVAAFVRPNDPAIDTVLHDASVKLAAAGKPGGIDGYAAGQRARTWDIAAAIWAALAARNITYVLPPASFERTGQKVRGPSEIIERKIGTCFDLSLLFAACLEQSGLNPLIVLTQGHAFVGIWLKKEEFSTAIVDDMQVLRKRRDLEDMIFIETTLLTSSPPSRFAVAVTQGAAHVDEGAASPLELAIDIGRARTRQIKPLDTGDASSSAVRPISMDAPVEQGIDEAPAFVEEVVAREEPIAPVDRLESWKRKLLDLSLRNKLLNFKDARKGVALECPDAARVEDMLTGGQSFKLLPRADVLDEADQRDAALFHERHQDDGRRRYLVGAIERGDLHSSLSASELDARLTDLFRMTRTSFEEGGANVLFLAIGFLKWTQKLGAAPLRAPLILLPVSLKRTSVRAGFRLSLHEEEPRFNPTLLEMLRHDFELTLPEFEKELPTDAAGLDIERIWQIMRAHIRDLPGWEVTTDVVLSTFSFTKFLMWKDLVDRMDVLKRNPVVKHLVDTPKQTYGDTSPFPRPSDIDREYGPAEIFTPLLADSSQLSAVLAAAKGKDFVLFGPPGTGKSQTIANMISQCLSLGKTVLFVSQKTAALEVVQRRMRDIGLGDYCLEVHSAKAQKSAVLGQLKAAWHERAAPGAEEWNVATSDLAKLRDELNELVAVLHHRRSNGMTAYEAFGKVVANRDRFTTIRFDWGSDQHNPEQVAELREICLRLKTALQAIGSVADHPLRGIRASNWSPAWRNEMNSAAQEMIACLAPIEDAARRFCEAAQLAYDPDHSAIRGLVLLGSIAAVPEATTGAALLDADMVSVTKAVGELEQLEARANALTARLRASFRPTIFHEDLRRLLHEWTAATNSSFVLRSARQKKVRQAVQPFSTSPLPPDISADLSTLIEINEVVLAADRLAPQLSVFGDLWKGVETEIAGIRASLEWAKRAREILGVVAPLFRTLPDQLKEHLARLIDLMRDGRFDDGPARSFEHLRAAWAQATAAIEVVANLAACPPKQPLAHGVSWVRDSITLVQGWRTNLHRAQAWCHWNEVAAQAASAGVSPIVDAITQGTLAITDIEKAFDAAYARWWADEIVTNDGVLRSFLAEHHEDAIARFQAADDRVTDLTKRIVRSRLGSGVPLPTAFGADPEWGTLSRELTKRMRLLPLRQLFATIPTALTKLTPCVMMSPLSIAQFLPASSAPFDLVIFDEASQIPVWDAIGAIARGKQVVVVGDPEQLPPTSVGERGVDEIEDGTDVQDQESILDECIAANIAPLRLDWHYRSKHESLIAFSNEKYYQGRLVTFPSPVTRDIAVRYVHVPDGVYERGSGRVNRQEARAVVAEIARRLKDPDFALQRSSLGVVTFNGEQQRLIENLLDQERRTNPEIEPFFDPTRWHEPVFVKNIENVQGDERDTILFSVAVAPDQSKRPVATISSLNKDGGHRRLNVAITRARREMVVFATLRPEQIDLSRTNARGVRDFKHFLEFAERGVSAIAETFVPTGLEIESPFEEAVKQALERRGWTVHPQVGVSKFRVDLGIVHPATPGRYIAGVECDGATYHRSATARDRDRLREHVLTELGWRIHRVWSTEWWGDAERAFEKLHQQLTTDVEADRIDEEKKQAAAQAAQLVREEEKQRRDEEAPAQPVAPDSEEEEAVVDDVSDPQPQEDTNDPVAVEPPISPPDHGVAREDQVYAKWPIAPGSAPLTGSPYYIADVAQSGHVPDPKAFYDPAHRERVRAMVAYVITHEGPIYDDVLVLRIARAHQFARAAGRIRDIVLGAIGSQFPRSTEGERGVIWPPGREMDKLIPFRDAPSDIRDHADIPIAELGALAVGFLSSGAGDEEVLRKLAAHFNLSRIREVTRQRLMGAVELARKFRESASANNQVTDRLLSPSATVEPVMRGKV